MLSPSYTCIIIKFLWLKVSIISRSYCLCRFLIDLIGLRQFSSLKKSFGKRLDAADEEILRFLLGWISGSNVWCLTSALLGRDLGAVGVRLNCIWSISYGLAILKINSDFLVFFFVTLIGISPSIKISIIIYFLSNKNQSFSLILLWPIFF